MNDNITIKIKNLNLYLNNNDLQSEITSKPIISENKIQDKTRRLEYYTWIEIDEIVKRGEHTKLFKIGDTKSFILNGETLIAQIADFNHDDKSDGTGKAGISFILKDCMDKGHVMNLTNTNEKGWPGSAMYSYLNNYLYTQLPLELQSVIKPVDKITIEGNKSTELETSSDKLWLMSKVEVFGGSKIFFTTDGEGTQYPIFTDNTHIIKKVNGSINWYWLRSPGVGKVVYFCSVGGNGGLHYDGASDSDGVAFGFCI